tara:strand:+ start:291 stop:440 length:150 start_codon:yes stop_codon:yes gene_type:complete
MAANAGSLPLTTPIATNKTTLKTFAVDGLKNIKGDMEVQSSFLANMANI